MRLLELPFRGVLGDMVVFPLFLLLGCPCAVDLLWSEVGAVACAFGGNYSVLHTLGGAENKSSFGISLVGALKGLI